MKCPVKHKQRTLNSEYSTGFLCTQRKPPVPETKHALLMLSPVVRKQIESNMRIGCCQKIQIQEIQIARYQKVKKIKAWSPQFNHFFERSVAPHPLDRF